MDITQNSFAVPVLLQLALEGRQEYLKIKEIPSNYNKTKPFTANFWLTCKDDINGKSHDILYDKSKSTDSEIYFLLPSEMFDVSVQYRCIFKLQINESVDFAVENFTIRIKPKKDDE